MNKEQGILNEEVSGSPSLGVQVPCSEFLVPCSIFLLPKGQGADAGADVTASGVFADIMRAARV